MKKLYLNDDEWTMVWLMMDDGTEIDDGLEINLNSNQFENQN